jgi:hypothetical protein
MLRNLQNEKDPMFTSDILENDKHLKNIVAYMLYSPQYKVGRFTDIHTIKQFINKLLEANLEEVKYLPKSKLHVYRTSDLGFGYSSYLSPARMHELIELGKIDKDITLELEYKYGNVFVNLDIESIDDKLLLTDDVYLLINKETKHVWNIIIGKPTNPNFLYYRSNLDGKKATLERLKLLENFNRVNITEKIVCDFI